MTNVAAIGKNERQFVCILSTESCVDRQVFDSKAVCPRDTPRRNFVVRERGIFCDFHLRPGKEQAGCEIDGSAKWTIEEREEKNGKGEYIYTHGTGNTGPVRYVFAEL